MYDIIVCVHSIEHVICKCKDSNANCLGDYFRKFSYELENIEFINDSLNCLSMYSHIEINEFQQMTATKNHTVSIQWNTYTHTDIPNWSLDFGMFYNSLESQQFGSIAWVHAWKVFHNSLSDVIRIRMFFKHRTPNINCPIADGKLQNELKMIWKRKHREKWLCR